MKSVLRFIAIYVVLSAVLGGLALLQSFPTQPRAWIGWLLLFALVIPVTLVADFLGQLAFRNPVSQAIERRTEGQGFSWLRVLSGFVLMLIFFSASIGLSQLFA